MVLSNSSTTQAWGPQSKRCFHTVLRGEERAKIHIPCLPETYVESIRKLMQHRYHMVRAHLLSSFNGREQSKQHRWLHLRPHSVQIQMPPPDVFSVLQIKKVIYISHCHIQGSHMTMQSLHIVFNQD